MKSLSPSDYEALYALFRLLEKGVRTSSLKEVCAEVNSRRRLNKQKPQSVQLIHYHMSKLLRLPFVKKVNNGGFSNYSLSNGTWKLNQNPPLCINITKELHLMVICDMVSKCKQDKPTTKCIQELVNKGKITLTIPS